MDKSSPIGPPRSASAISAIEGYLNDTDPNRAEKYGFRSGQNPQLAWSWFRDYPVGFNGVPFVLFKTILDLDPEHTDPALQRIARIWKREAAMPLGSGPAATSGRSITSASDRVRSITSTALRGRSSERQSRFRSGSPSRTRGRSNRCRQPT